MKLRNIDLNLLVILDALLDEAHVARAAARVGLSQPAASNALARARALFDDPLLVRASSRRLRLTPRAESLREPLHAALAELSALVTTERIEGDGPRGAVRLIATDLPSALGAAVAREVADRAPDIDLIFHSWHVGDEVERLEKGEVDLVVTAAPARSAAVRTDPIGRFPYVVAMRHDHPAAEPGALSVDRWLRYPHLVVSGRGERSGSVDAALVRLNRKRRVAVVVPTFLQALELLRETELIGSFPSAVLEGRSAAGIVSRPVPIEIEPVVLHLARHRRSDGDPGTTIVADIIRELSERLPGWRRE